MPHKTQVELLQKGKPAECELLTAGMVRADTFDAAFIIVLLAK